MDYLTQQAMDDILDELESSKKKHPIYPTDAVRRAAIMLEEAGEVIKAALDVTRPDGPYGMQDTEGHLYEELKQTAAMALRNMVAIRGDK